MALPTGTVTFLFSDIEGSTRLLARLGDAYGTVLADQRRIVRATLARYGGDEVDTQGDAFFVAFARAQDAVAAAVEIQQALAAYRGPQDVNLCVRMGLHTGEPVVAETGYVGMDVHRAARICAAGHGGQVLLSQATLALVGRALPGGVTIRPLGEHNLKDLAQPEPLYQLLIPGLRNDFPPLKSLGALPNNLPVQLTRFIGREREITEAERLLRQARLLTLTGPGGSGKTRLALLVATRAMPDFRDGVFFVSMGATTEPALVAPAIAQGLGIVGTAGVPITENLKNYLKSKQTLLLLDGFEQVIEGAPLLSELLAAAPQVKLLVTSRIVLNLSGEHSFPVPPLDLPAAEDLQPEQLEGYAAIRLFVDRAAALSPAFVLDANNAPLIARICRRLDGLPLAIELAAARTRQLSPRALLARLQTRLPLLTDGPRDAPERQRTLRATIGWSYQLLGEGEKRVFSRLAVFAGGGSLEAAEAIDGAAGGQRVDMLRILSTLADNSLLQLAEGSSDELRFTILDTIREYGLEQLAARGEEPAVAQAHAEYYAGLAEAGEAGLKGPEQLAWVGRLSTEQSNFRAAMAWAIQSGQVEIGLRLGTALRLFWERHGDWAEGSSWLQALLKLGGPPRLRARGLLAATLMQFKPAATTGGLPWLEESRTLAREAGDRVTEAAALLVIGRMRSEREGVAAGLQLMDESLALARSAGDAWTAAWILHWIGRTHFRAGYSPHHVASARAALSESSAIFERCGDHLAQVEVQTDLAYFDGIQAEDDVAYRTVIARLAEIVSWCRRENAIAALHQATSILAEVAWCHEDYECARQAYEDTVALARNRGLRPALSLANLAAVALHDGDWRRARQLLTESWEACTTQGLQRYADFLLTMFACIFVVREQPTATATVLGSVDVELERLGAGLEVTDQRRFDQALAAARRQLTPAQFLAAWEHGRSLSAADAYAYSQEQLDLP